MSSRNSQRMLPWRNVDTTSQPICPPFGHVEVIGSEFVGTNIVLLGRSSKAFDLDATDIDKAGQSSRAAFNGELSVEPGDIGMLTFDTPTWAAIAPQSTFFAESPLFDHPVFGSLLGLEKIQYPGGVFRCGAPWKLGVLSLDGFGGADDLRPPGRLKFRAYYYDNQTVGSERCWIGGLRTFIKNQNGVRRQTLLPTTSTTTTTTSTSTTTSTTTTTTSTTSTTSTTTTTTTTAGGPTGACCVLTGGTSVCYGDMSESACAALGTEMSVWHEGVTCEDICSGQGGVGFCCGDGIPPCGTISYVWASGAWYVLAYACESPCTTAPEPARDGLYEGEVIAMECTP